MKSLTIFFCFFIYLNKTSEFIFFDKTLPTVSLKKLPVEEKRETRQQNRHTTYESYMIHKYTRRPESVTIYPSIVTWEYECSIDPNTTPYQWELLFTALTVNKQLTNEYKCLLACINKKIGIQDANGRYNRVGFIEALEKIKPYYHGKDFVNNKRKTITCLDRTSQGKNECDTADKLLKCVDTTQIKAFQGFRKAITDNKTLT
ncbi:hypothetical protein ILUMI_02430 [Ignelater luminosus]|uniref:Uncharacterized protein n=1 Tax=Ignelater luminosus TaxID=2038154 RepID=A0A8K0DGI4_IGNLU|nr:hypothetical protein ILUMI_02430 [Ignelater luminosus]